MKNMPEELINQVLMQAFVETQPEKKVEPEPVQDEPKIIQNAIKLPDGTYFNSKHHYDFHSREIDGKLYYVDGGYDYIRRGSMEGAEEYSLMSDASTAEIYNKLMWGSNLDENGNPLRETVWNPIKELDVQHLNMILLHYQHIKLQIDPLHEQCIKYWIARKAQ